MKTVRIAIIGHGFMGHEHEAMLSEMDGIQLVGISDIDPVQLEDVKKGIKRYQNNEELFADPEVDVVLIAANNNQHHDLVIQAARAGKDVICEKPVAMSLEELDDMVRVTEECGVKFTVHHQRRMDPDFRIMKEVYDMETVILKERITYQQIAEISDHLHQAENIAFYSSQEGMLHVLQKAMILSGKKANVYEDISTQEDSLKAVGENTAVFAVIPDLLEMTPLRSILKKAKRQGAFIISICSDPQNAYEKYSDLQIGFEGTKTSMDTYLFMILVNLIQTDYCRRYVEEVLEELYE